MKFLLFLLGIIFFFIFFLFSQISEIEGYFLPDLFITANMYMGISISIILILFFSYSQKNPQESEGKGDGFFGYIPSLGEVSGFIKDFFSHYIYYIACLLFYGALYLILKSTYPQVNIPSLFLLLNIIVLSLYFIEHKFKVFQDFIRVNLILISLYYIIAHVLFISGWGYDFHIFDIANIIGVFLLFGILLQSNRSQKYSQILRHYFIVFCFLEISTIYKILFSGEILSLGFIAGVIGVLFLMMTPTIQKISHFQKSIIRTWGLIFLSVFITVSLFYIGNEDIYALVLIPALGVSAQVLLSFHYKFQNYGAVTLSIIGYILAIFGVYTIIFSESVELEFMGLLFLILSLGVLFIYKIYKRNFLYDVYFFHTLSLLVNLIGVFCFFYLRDFSILSLGLLLLGESIYLFFSYYTVSKTKTLG